MVRDPGWGRLSAPDQVNYNTHESQSTVLEGVEARLETSVRYGVKKQYNISTAASDAFKSASDSCSLPRHAESLSMLSKSLNMRSECTGRRAVTVAAIQLPQ